MLIKIAIRKQLQAKFHFVEVLCQIAKLRALLLSMILFGNGKFLHGIQAKMMNHSFHDHHH